jgi:hypothetical protein
LAILRDKVHHSLPLQRLIISSKAIDVAELADACIMIFTAAHKRESTGNEESGNGGGSRG